MILDIGGIKYSKFQLNLSFFLLLLLFFLLHENVAFKKIVPLNPKSKRV